MLKISEQDIARRLNFDNPWWGTGNSSESTYRDLRERSYLAPFVALVESREVRRAVILLGPRRVGKTVILHQTIGKLRTRGVSGNRILYLSLDTPIYTDTALDAFVQGFIARFSHARDTPLTVIFDEVQYLKDWEVHLKSLVDSYPSIRFIASGSAAAALKLKSRESGAGRFTEFLLPPLTFAEYLAFVDKEDALISDRGSAQQAPRDIDALNLEFVEYLNIGGYPEAVLNRTVRDQSARFIKSDIIDKVLMRDLPQLYGIRDIQELNRLFTTLAYNTGNEVSLDGLAQSSGVSKTTLARYVEYLEAAFLIRCVHRIDENARHFKRARTFKVYLTNPSMRSALFGAPADDDEAMGALAETALFAQYFHNATVADSVYYGRWPRGEIDLVVLNPKTQKPAWAIEVKWSDRPAKDSTLLGNLEAFALKHPSLGYCQITTRTFWEQRTLRSGIPLHIIPTSYVVYKTAQEMLKLAGAAISPSA